MAGPKRAENEPGAQTVRLKSPLKKAEQMVNEQIAAVSKRGMVTSSGGYICGR